MVDCSNRKLRYLQGIDEKTPKLRQAGLFRIKKRLITQSKFWWTKPSGLQHSSIRTAYDSEVHREAESQASAREAR